MAGGTNGPLIHDGAAFSYPTKTLDALRDRLYLRTGHAALMATPMPGVSELYTDFLQGAQEQLYERFIQDELRLWWKIPVTQGNRHYGVPSVSTGAQDDISFTADSTIERVAGSFIDDGFRVGDKITISGGDNDGTQVTIATLAALTITATETTITTEAAGTSITITTVNWRSLDLRNIDEVWLLDDQTWHRMSEGISPSRFNETGQAWPQNYEITDHIEVWPEPDKTYTMYIKGFVALMPFTDDAHVTTIPPTLVFLMALANAKAHYGHGDAGTYYRQLEVHLGALNAKTFGDKRYIPGRRREAPALSKPVGTWRP